MICWKLTILLLLCASASAADLRLEHQRSFEAINLQGETVFQHEMTEVVFLSEQAARYDARIGSFIVRTEDGIFLWLDHEARTFAEARLPVTMEELLSDDDKKCIESFPGVVKDAEATVQQTGEEKTIGDWQSAKIHVEGQFGEGLSFVDDRWITHELEVDLEPYHLLIGAKAALSLRTRGWIDELLAEGGYPVESETIESSPKRRRIYRNRLVDVREIESDETRYQPPAGYVRDSRFPLDFRCVGSET